MAPRADAASPARPRVTASPMLRAAAQAARALAGDDADLKATAETLTIGLEAPSPDRRRFC